MWEGSRWRALARRELDAAAVLRANKCGGGNPRIGQDEGRDRIVRLGNCLEADVGHIDATENQAMSGATEFEIASTSPLTSCYTGVRSMVH
jgi:hypothetical protein